MIFKTRRYRDGWVWIFSVALLSLAAAAKPANRAPVIKHEAIKTAVPGQTVSIRAGVTDDSGKIKAVTLNCSPSKDAAPVKIPMQDSGAGSYVGTIPDSMVTGAIRLSYYIEALDQQDLATETPWYTITIQSGTSRPVAPSGQAEPVAEKPEEKNKWKGPALIAGGSAAVIGGALWALNRDDGDSTSGDSGSTNSASNFGTYLGSATRILEMTGASPVSTSYSIIFSVTSDNLVITDTLNPGSHLEAGLSGSDFQMSGDVSEGGGTGTITYSGTVMSGRITGSMAGTATSSSGTNGTYTGVFSATRQ